MDKIIFETANSLQFKNCTLTYGHFDLVHPGHIRFLRKASNQGNKLVVALMPDKRKGESLNFQFNQLLDPSNQILTDEWGIVTLSVRSEWIIGPDLRPY